MAEQWGTSAAAAWTWTFWALVALGSAGVLAAAFSWWRRGTSSRASEPEQILKTRYARGEVDRAEYRKRLEDLKKS
jgi:uncharacterized membrane protein